MTIAILVMALVSAVSTIAQLLLLRAAERAARRDAGHAAAELRRDVADGHAALVAYADKHRREIGQDLAGLVERVTNLQVELASQGAQTAERLEQIQRDVQALYTAYGIERRRAGTTS